MNETPPELQRFVEAAREQVIAPTHVTADAVLAGLERHRDRTQARRTITLSAAIALAASLITVSLLWPMLSARDASPPRDPAGHAGHAGHATGHAAGQAGGITNVDAPEHQAASLDLDSAVSLRTNTQVEVRGPWSLALGEGVHELEVQATPGQALRVSLPGLELELAEGNATIEVVQSSAAVKLHNGVAAWIGEDGQRTVLNVEHVDLQAPSATELAREAERLLAAGKPDKAVAVLRRLVAAYPKASQTRTGLLDLARLLRNSTRKDEARCAYELYLQRWPGSAVDGEVRAALARLGPGRACRGLDPR
ncbi:hypothetical protein DB30_07359 [Enhygromyxa salina]|uniref:Tetratricopeptide repeat protein n=1 Tax=Enhygromyxa salina TaxID=215803 RepID=A0A0C1ZS88_9BACT|nr:tetratricopeptide repeat protein [Enhygromyxa salina]KIG13943.1 hypothetical protein DB30_07359 [Enhygromyxa salina]